MRLNDGFVAAHSNQPTSYSSTENVELTDCFFHIGNGAVLDKGDSARLLFDLVH